MLSSCWKCGLGVQPLKPPIHPNAPPTPTTSSSFPTIYDWTLFPVGTNPILYLFAFLTHNPNFYHFSFHLLFSSLNLITIPLCKYYFVHFFLIFFLIIIILIIAFSIYSFSLFFPLFLYNLYLYQYLYFFVISYHLIII